MGEGKTDNRPVTFARLQEIGLGWLGLSETEFWGSTLHSFNCRLKGWQEVRATDWEEDWRRVRRLCGYMVAAGNWKKVPDVMADIPLPNDPKAEPKFITISDAEMAHRKYKLKKRDKVTFHAEFENLMRAHWVPAWGPHPDEL